MSLPEISFLSLVVTISTFLLAFILCKLFIGPYLGLLYYKRQGLAIKFHRKLVPMFQFWRDVRQKDDFFYAYKQTVKAHPETKAIAENFLSRVRISLFDPEMIKEYLRKYEIYEKDQTFTGLLDELVTGAIAHTEGVKWKNRRKILSAAFNFEFLKESIPMIVNATQKNFAQWVEKGELTNQDLVEKLSLITGEVTGRFIFGKRFEDQKIDGVPMSIMIQRIMVNIMADVISLPNLLFGAKAAHTNIIPRQRKLNADIAKMRGLCKKFIDEEAKRGEGEDTKFLRLLLDLRKKAEEDDPMTNEEITGEFIGFFLAGTDTTSHLVGSALYFLWKHPHVFARVKAEVDREFVDISKLEVDSLNRMDYTVAVLKETLRLGGPIVTMFERVATRDDDLCGLKVKKGTAFNLCTDVIYSSEKYFSRASEFLPERWIDDPAFSNDGFKKETYSFVPFSSGPRNCIGQHLAMIEARILLGLFIQTFSFSFPENYKLVLAKRFVFGPLEPYMITMTPKI